MRQKYYLKLTYKNGRSGYNQEFIYPECGEIAEPNADYNSNDPCGKGIHLAKTISGGLKYFSNPSEIRLALVTGKIAGQDDCKIRVDKCHILCLLPRLLYDDYDAEHKLLDDDYSAKCKPLYDDYNAKHKPLDDDHNAKRKLLDDDYNAKCKPLDDDYKAKHKLLDRKFMQKAIRYYKKMVLLS